MDSRIEEVLNILLSGDIASFEPLSRNQQYLKACCNKTGTDGLPIPMSRIEALLYRLADEFPNSGGSDLSDATATAEDIRKDKVAYGASGKIIGTAGASLKDFIKVRGGCKYLFYESTMITVGDLITFEDTSSVTDMYSMFYNCSSLTTVPLFDTSSVTNMSSMFQNCSSLTTVPSFDTRSVTNMTNMFNNCKNLTECWIRNIKSNLQVGSSTSYGHLLTLESLEHLIQELLNIGASRTLTVGSANLKKAHKRLRQNYRYNR